MGRKSRDKKRDDRARPAAAASSEPGEAAAPASSPVTRPPARSTRRRALPTGAWLWGAALVAITFVVYQSGLHTPFLLDDPINITKNPLIQKPLSWFSLWRDPRALVTLSLRWNWLGGGSDVTGYHLLNIAAHALTGWLVFLLARSTLALLPDASRFERNRDAISGVIALVFLLHPMQTESVTYVIQRAEIFAAAALVACLLLLAEMREGLRPALLVQLAAACLLGIYSKPSFAVAPALLALYDLCFLSRDDPKRLRERWPAYAITVAAMLAAFLLSKSGGSLESSSAGFEMDEVTPRDYVSSQFGVALHYLRVALWPARLCFDCGYRAPWPVMASWLGESVLLPATILSALAVVAMLLWKRRPLVTFAVLGSAIALSPTSLIPLSDFYVEHRMYLPIALLAFALVPLAWELVQAAAGRLGRATAGATAGAALAALLVLALSLLTVSRNLLLANPIALMEDALAQAPQNERVQYNLANALKRAGRMDEAIPHYEEAIRLLPNVMRSYENLGGLYMEQGKIEQAVETFEGGVRAKPGSGMAHRNLANALLRLGRKTEALAEAEKSLEIEKHPNGYRLRGDALQSLGRQAEAAASYREGLGVAPNDATLKERVAKTGSR